MAIKRPKSDKGAGHTEHTRQVRRWQARKPGLCGGRALSGRSAKGEKVRSGSGSARLAAVNSNEGRTICPTIKTER